VSTRSPAGIERARNEGAAWAADASKEALPEELDAAILFPPVGGLVEPILSHVKPGGCLVMAPVSSTPITVAEYSANLWGRDIKTLYQLRRSDAEEFLQLVNRLRLNLGVSIYDFQRLDEALIHAKQGKLTEPNAVIAVRP
jgi:propanol-preferring alcohol dehydrogenase